MKPEDPANSTTATSAVAKWVDELFATLAALRNHPRPGRRVPEVGRVDAREVLYGADRIVYRVDPARLFVLTVRHGRRAWDPGENDAGQ